MDISKYKRGLVHITFWVVIISFFMTAIKFGRPDESFFYHLSRLIGIYLLIIPCVYINLYYLMPQFLQKRKYFLYSVGLIIIISLYAVLKNFIKLKIFNDPLDESLLEETISSILVIISYMLFTMFLKYMFQFFNERMKYNEISLKLKEIEKQKLEAELSALKGQLNPHFMFNTLNNIYSLSLDKSDKAPELILKLSDLMSYSLYECRDKYVSLQHEIEFVHNYIDLERVRLDDNVSIEVNVHGEAGNIKIAPLLLMPLIENAFKHGLRQRPENAYVVIDIDLNSKDKVAFSIKNNINSQFIQNKQSNSGIGINNVKKRLELLYSDKHTFEIERSDDTFKVEMKIQLNG
jgi:LytS/YehU family sensor histidine kinase